MLHSAPSAECPCCLPLFVPLTNLIALLVATARNQIIEKLCTERLSSPDCLPLSTQNSAFNDAVAVLQSQRFYLPPSIFFLSQSFITHYTTVHVSHTVSAQFIPVGMILPSNQISLKLRWCLAASEITTNISENLLHWQLSLWAVNAIASSSPLSQHQLLEKWLRFEEQVKRN